MAQVRNIPIYKNGQVISYFSGDDSALPQQVQSLGGTLTSNTVAQSGTPAPTPPLPTLPKSAPAAPDSTVTLPKKSDSPILSFANSLDAAVNLARKSRNASSVDMMKPFQGTVAASDFNSILNNINTASDKTSENLIKKVSDITNPDIITSTDSSGNVHGINKNTGAVVWTTPGMGKSRSDLGDTLIHSGALDYTKTDYSADASALEQSRGTDGWVDPTIYQKLYDAWVLGGGKIADFVKTYPPEQYVNPANDWLPPYLRPKKSGVANPFAQ